MINVISKPLIVDLLRTFDKNKWLSPKIRYASVRSKSDLIKDLKRHFTFEQHKKLIRFLPKACKPRHPVIEFDLRTRLYSFDGRPLDVPEVSREVPPFEFRHGNFVLFFDQRDTFPTQASEGVHATQTESAFFRASPAPGTRAPSDCSERSEPSLLCV